MRILYLDESGIGQIDKDPALVVAGVLIDPDTQWMPLASRLRSILSDAIPDGVKAPKHLHAKDIYHGTKEFSRDKWEVERRFKILDRVAALPEEFQLPVVWTSMDRKAFAREHPGMPAAEQLRNIYTIAAVSCFFQVEVYMRAMGKDLEAASIIMESNSDLQRRIPEVFSYMRDLDPTSDYPAWRNVLPLQRLIDAPAYQPKTASSILQLADFCAFAIKRRLEGRADSARFTGPMVKRFMQLREARVDSEQVLWNPIVNPKAWNDKLKFDGNRFVFSDQQADENGRES